MTQRSETEVPFGPSKGRAGWLFTAIWLIYLAYPLGQLFDGHPAPVKVGLVLGAVAVFSVAYVRVGILADRDWDTLPPDRLGNPRKLVLLGLMAALTLALSLAVDADWIALWIYVASAGGIALPLGKAPPWAMRGGLAVAAIMSVQALALGIKLSDWLSLLLPCVLSCLGVIGIRGMHELIRQLQMARAEVARLAAGEERLRMARDLHDLAGHSLATITLKAELSRKLLRVDQDRAEQQIFDLEHVSRQALADIREAVSGYRRATLAVESASARTALRAAGIEPALDPSVLAHSGSLHPDAESALAWCLREAVTNVVRHSGARTCRIRLIDARVDGEPSITLEVLDDGPAAPERPGPDGNGLAGLRERLRAVSAESVLTAGPVEPGGFRLTATVPARLAA
ncbi:MAG TPA: sensor histidine kinase [Actinospica sp.]|nr:sensor histidine kinase [Actinospica sp.]